MNEQWINDTCMMFQNTFKDINMTTVRNILTLALMDCEITKYTKAVTVYAGEPNEQIVKAFIVAKRVAGASDKTCKYYQFILGQFLNKIGMYFDKVTANDIRIYFAKRELDDKVSAATQQEKKINFKTKTVYADPAAKDARAKLRAYLSKEIPEKPLTGPIHLTVIWGFPAKGKHQNGDWHISKPDLDNLQKALQDVMTELGYFTDDCRICQLQTSKIYTYHPGVSIMANEMEGNAYEGIHC